MKKVSITNLDAVRDSLATSTEEYREKHRLDLIRIEVSRECAEWLLADIDKRRKRLEQCVNDAKTREAKREKRERELNFVAYASDIINYGLKHPISK